MLELIDEFTAHLTGQDLSPRTVQGYARDVRLFAGWFEHTNGKPATPTNVTPLDVREYRQHLQAVKKQKPSTINRKLAALRAFFGWATRVGHVPGSPVEDIHDVPQARRAPQWLERPAQYKLLRTAQEQTRLADAKGLDAGRWRARRDEAVVALLLHAGLRVGEACALDLDDVELGERSGKVVVRSGKRGKYREVPLNRDARQALAEWLKVRPALEGIDGLLVGQKGNRLSSRSLQSIVARLARLADLEEVTPHVLRHCLGKNLVDTGVSLDRVAMLLGHENLNTTAIYTTPSQSDLSAAVEQVAWGD
jgi:integrase/recombinase XerD